MGRVRFTVRRSSYGTTAPDWPGIEESHDWRGESHQGWVVEINTLEEFIAFCDKVEFPVILDSEVDELEIYDDYRE